MTLIMDAYLSPSPFLSGTKKSVFKNRRGPLLPALSTWVGGLGSFLPVGVWHSLCHRQGLSACGASATGFGLEGAGPGDGLSVVGSWMAPGGAE